MWWLYFFGFAFIAFFIFIIYIIFFKKKYTRERFAFFSIFSIITFASITIIPVFSGNSTFILLSQIANEMFGWSLSSESTIYDKVLSLIVFGFVVWLIQKIHSNWDGSISERQYLLDRNSIQSGMIEDAIAQIKKDNISKHIESKKQAFVEEHIESPLTNKDRISKLLIAYSPQYKIDTLDDWYEEYECFFSVYGKGLTPVFIHCPSKELSIETIENLKNIKTGLNLSDCNYTLITPTTNVSTIDFNGLGFNQVKVYDEKYLLNKLVDIPSYKKHLETKVKTERLPGGSNLTLNETYIDSSGKLNDKSEIPSVAEYVTNWINDKESGHIAILGDYGQGKSTLSYKLAFDISNDINASRLPVIIELRGKSPRTMSVEEMAFSWCKKFGVTTDAFLSLNIAGRLVIILEGFDEMDFVGDAEIRMSHFRSLWRFAENNNAKLIFTGRPNFFTVKGDELPRALLTNKSITSKRYCTPIRLLPFNNEQVKSALRAFPEHIKSQLIKVVSDKSTPPEISSLLKRPSTLIWAASAWDKLEESFKEGSMVSANVIGAILAQSYDRQLNKKLKTAILAVEREFFTVAIALKMHELRPNVNQISSEELEDLIKAMLERLPKSLMDFSAINEEVSLNLSERFSSKDRLIETVLTDVRTCGILVDDISRTGYIKFAHKSFYEYLVGSAVAFRQLGKSSNEDIKNYIARKPMHVIANTLSPEISSILFVARSNSFQVMQFSGQIFAQVIFKNNKNKEPRFLSNKIKSELNTFNMRTAIRICKLSDKGNLYNRMAVAYLPILCRYAYWKIIMWFHGSISIGMQRQEMEAILGENTVNILHGGEGINENPMVNNQMCYYFGSYKK